MENLEELGLYLTVCVNETSLDGNHLKRMIINRMPRLNQFMFYINSSMSIDDQLSLLSTEDIQRTFIDFPNSEIISYVDYFPETEDCQCHIYSNPSRMEYYDEITNQFPGGLFHSVRFVSLFDEHPFEHDFFLRIVQSFPFLQHLFLNNEKPQNRKESYPSNNDYQLLFPIKYSFLTVLTIIDSHDDYVEQFLLDTKTYLSNNILFLVDYESLQRVTHNFTRDATRINCGKINQLVLSGGAECVKPLEEYFPNADISYPIICSRTFTDLSN